MWSWKGVENDRVKIKQCEDLKECAVSTFRSRLVYNGVHAFKINSNGKEVKRRVRLQSGELYVSSRFKTKTINEDFITTCYCDDKIVTIETSIGITLTLRVEYATTAVAMVMVLGKY